MVIFSENPLVDKRVAELSKQAFKSLDKALQNSKDVQYLELSGPLMKDITNIEIPSSIAKLTNLEVLDILHYTTIKFPDNLHALQKLHTVILLGNEFATDSIELGDKLRDLPALYSLHISGFYPLILTDNFAKLQKLKRLFIDDCRLKGLSHICRITSIEELSLDCEVLTDSFDALQNLTNLKKLRLFTDQVPPVVQKLQVETLSLSATKLKSLPAWLALLPSLKELDISYSNVESLPPGFVNLTVMDVRRTPLEKKLPELKAEFPHIQFLV